MLSILADECVDVQLVFRLRRLGYAVSTVRDFCQSKYGDGIEDRAVLELGRKHRLAVLTANESHFINLHRQCPWHHGILIIDAEADVQAQARRIAAALRTKNHVRGQIVWLTPAATSSRSRRMRKGSGSS